MVCAGLVARFVAVTQPDSVIEHERRATPPGQCDVIAAEQADEPASTLGVDGRLEVVGLLGGELSFGSLDDRVGLPGLVPVTDHAPPGHPWLTRCESLAVPKPDPR